MHQVTLADDRHALPRLLARLHAVRLDVQHLTVRGRVVELDLPPRALAVVRRSADVVSVREVPPTRVVVTRHRVAPAATTPHPWLAA